MPYSPRVLLSDRDLRAEIEAGRLVVEPFDPEALQPSSIDLRVGSQFRVFANHRYTYIDPARPQEHLTELVEATQDEPFILHPGEFVLGSTLETVKIPDDLVARLEGKSSLGRLGLLIHSSLPGDEPVLFEDVHGLRQLPIQDVVRKRMAGRVAAFDPETFEIGYHEITGWHEFPADRVFEVVLASGRKVSVTAGHCIFSLDPNGDLVRVRVGELRPGTLVAVPGRIPDPPSDGRLLDLLSLVREHEYPDLVCSGPAVDRAFARRGDEIGLAFQAAGVRHGDFYRTKRNLPLHVARQVTGLVETFGPQERLRVKGGRHSLPCHIEVDQELAWLIGIYVAEGCRRRTQVTISNTNGAILDRVEQTFERLGLPVYRRSGAITCCSGLVSRFFGWIEAGDGAHAKTIPNPVLSWPSPLLESFTEGFIDGDGSREATRVSLWTSSPKLAAGLLLLCSRSGKRASARFRRRPPNGGLFQVSVPHREHKLLTSVPNPSGLLIDLRRQVGLTQKAAAALAGFRYPTQLNNMERRRWNAVRLVTLRRLGEVYGKDPAPLQFKLDRLVEGDLRWDRVSSVRSLDEPVPVFDLEVRPGGRPIENFVAGRGGILVSNTAGFVDAGFSGELTLELSNVANLPIAIYPGMRVGQLCLLRMTSPAERPYGREADSKYQGQQGPTPSRYFENFRDEGS